MYGREKTCYDAGRHCIPRDRTTGPSVGGASGARDPAANLRYQRCRSGAGSTLPLREIDQ
jgi:hypothetical protein